MNACARSWAHDEFGDAALGDQRLADRLCEMAATVARRPAGKLTRVFATGAAREAAYRFVENDRVDPAAILAAHQAATGHRAAAHPFVYVAIDQSAVQITDRTGKGFGPVGRKDFGAGVQAMSALALAPTGEPLGLAALDVWTRDVERCPDYKADRRPVSERETQFWLDAATQTAALMATHAPGTQAWLQLDRGADSTAVLEHLTALGLCFTIRSSSDRRIRAQRGCRDHLDACLRRAPRLGTYRLPAARDDDGHATSVVMEVRIATVELDLPHGFRGRGPRRALRVTVVDARQRDATGTTPLHWRLLTNRTVRTLDDARAVIAGYTMRWRVEDFHLAWKSGTCHIEQTRVRSLPVFARWATILAAVAVRAQHLLALSREQPNLPATVAFSRDEIEAVIILRKPRGVARDADPTLGQLVRWIADLGGYVGPSNGPPGIRILSRALVEVTTAANVVAAMRKPRRRM